MGLARKSDAAFMWALASFLILTIASILAGLWWAVNMDVNFLSDGIEDDEEDDMVGHDA